MRKFSTVAVRYVVHGEPLFVHI